MVVCRKRLRELVEPDEDTRDRVERANQRKERKESVVRYVNAKEEKSPQIKCRQGVALPPDAGKRKSSQTQPKHIAKLQKEMQMQMMQQVAEEIDVAGIYSPPRATKRARQ